MRPNHPLPRLWLLALRATFDLALARIALRSITPQAVLHRNHKVAGLASGQAPKPDQGRIDRQCDDVAFFVNRMAARVPWRSDCLVQALAGQRWLARAEIASEIIVGTAKHADGSFESHAWLRQDGRIVLGGDISTYQPLLDPAVMLFRND